MIRHSQSTERLRKSFRNLINADSIDLDQFIDEELVIQLLNAVLSDSGYNDRVNLSTRSRAITSAIEYIEDNRYDAITVRELCKNTETSIRTLDRAFGERFGLAPKAYIRNRRLTGAKKALTKSKGTDSVVEIANGWGFWHMGQFARDYRRLFGELPSETLDRRSHSKVSWFGDDRIFPQLGGDNPIG
jgi:transcriptional regulator GlxA family with amidase domain